MAIEREIVNVHRTFGFNRDVLMFPRLIGYADALGYYLDLDAVRKGWRVNVDLSGVVGSLCVDRYDGEMFTCTCGDPGCAGIDSQRMEADERTIRWILNEDIRGSALEIHFDRVHYEWSAMRMLVAVMHCAPCEGGIEYWWPFDNNLPSLLVNKLKQSAYLLELWDRECAFYEKCMNTPEDPCCAMPLGQLEIFASNVEKRLDRPRKTLERLEWGDT